MAKIENTKMTVSLDTESKRIIRNLTRAIDQHNTIYRDDVRLKYRDHESGLDGQPVRLAEPAEDPALSDDNEDHSLSPVELSQESMRAIHEVNSTFGLGKYNALR